VFAVAESFEFVPYGSSAAEGSGTVITVGILRLCLVWGSEGVENPDVLGDDGLVAEVCEIDPGGFGV